MTRIGAVSLWAVTALTVIAVIAFFVLLAGCDNSLTFEEIDAASRACLNAGTVPRVHYRAKSNEISGVTCEPK